MLALSAGALASAVLAGCTPGDGAAPSSGAATTTLADDTSAADDDATESGRADTAEPDVVRVPAGPVVVEIAAPPPPSTTPGEGDPAVAVSAGDEGTSDVRLVLADAPARISVEDGSLVRHADGTLTVLDDAGTSVGGLDAPRVLGAHDIAPHGAAVDGRPGSPGVQVVLVDAHHAEVTLVPAAGAPSGITTGSAAGADSADSAPGDDAGGTGSAGDGPAAAWDVVVTLGTQAVRSTDWGDREGGRSLAVDPTAWARGAGQAGQELVWAQVVAAEPESDTPTMHDQLVCHAVGAPDKATWNLEPWRPDVGLLATMAARCNPT
ncbi:DUF2599 domain-containing protein [Cellulosimicrobium protaetiae]|uniref:DUF2599 domain-containing protein n=1 Tax=Cellulosimicrobium protaetiae TaxID=2587808 RepID=A0A6M5UKN5_9MICO|nr:DUF2599 domain-containing protein [Cellulosimicrobium protaetiae]QJW37923.1 DUF2599 domain-containing protein [Cellulosimicrobium protaetiae]